MLLHGAWHGGWCWREVADILRSGGCRVSTPTQTGLGELAHLLSDKVDFETFVADILRHIADEGLQDAVLVGHSFGGHVATAVADRLRDKISKIIYLDGFLPQNGCAAMDLLPEDVSRKRLHEAEETSGGLTMPVPGVETLGLKDESQKRYVASMMTPHPLRTYLSTVRLSAPLGNGLPCAYIQCVNPVYRSLESSVAFARAQGWSIHQVPFGHDVMIEAPRETAHLLQRLAG